MFSFVSSLFIFGVFCFSSSVSSPVLSIDDDFLSASIFGVADPASESRIAGPVRHQTPAPLMADSAPLMADSDPGKVVDVDDKGVSIVDLFAPDITSINVEDEERAHREEPTPDVPKPCPPGTEGVQPFCVPIASGADSDYEDQDVPIPIEFYAKIAGLTNLEEFINLTKIDVGFVVPKLGPGVQSLASLPSRGCIPKKVCIDVRPRDRHPSEDYFPSSVDVERCGGCCGHPDLTCLPWSTEPTTLKLLKFGYNPDGTIYSLGFHHTSIIREVKCRCDKVQT